MVYNSKSPSLPDYQRITNGFNGAGEMILFAKLNCFNRGKTILVVRKFTNTSQLWKFESRPQALFCGFTLIRGEISSKMLNENFNFVVLGFDENLG